MTKEILKTIVGESWVDLLIDLFNDKRMDNILQILGNEVHAGRIVYPEKKNVFRAFQECPLNELNVVFIGQDPYHQANQATGLCFGVPMNIKKPPSLVNILNELFDEYKEEIEKDKMLTEYFDSSLIHWAYQGCLLLNTSLTVVESIPGSHAIHWKWFTEEVLKRIQEQKEKIIFVRWGNHAKQFYIDLEKHYCLDSGHPSPLNTSIPFKGNNHFRRINEILKEQGKESVNWFFFPF